MGKNEELKKATIYSGETPVKIIEFHRSLSLEKSVYFSKFEGAIEKDVAYVPHEMLIIFH